MDSCTYLGAVAVICTSLIIGSTRAATVIHVPADKATIQAGINAAIKGDTVLVSPGTYNENINFRGKAITVKSSMGPKVTIIDGGGVSAVVTFASKETLGSLLRGFTIRNGLSGTSTSNYVGGGILISNASPTIQGNIIENNLAEYGGGGIGISLGSPLIKGNTIQNNGQSPAYDFGAGGGGIGVIGAGSAQIVGNVIRNNSWNNAGAGFGGGIALYNSGSTLVENNIIQGNVAGTWGAGMWTYGDTSGTVVAQNLITGNSAPENDSGLYLDSTLAALVNNTITDGRNVLYSSRYTVLLPDDASTIVANNLIIAFSSATSALECINSLANPANFYNNNVYSSQGPAYVFCTDQTGTNGNISVNPEFVGKSNFNLKAGSPAIDAGNNSAPDLPSTDLGSNARIINGNDGAAAVVDMGAYEFAPVVLAPKNLGFGVQAVGSNTSKSLVLTNAQDKVLDISSFSVPTGYSLSGCGSSVAAFKSCTITVTFHPLTTGTFNGTLTVRDNAGNTPQTIGLSGNAH
jgi:ASPM-SPD-2-Hydin domain-containing protein